MTISLCVQTYNHREYIAQCLEGIVTQKTTFPFEVLVHDDASTDGTGDVVRDYAVRYPDLIKPLFQTENQYRKPKINICKDFQYPRAQGRYIALCEGDDYWIDDDKLERQVAYLKANPDCSLVAENGYTLFVDSGRQELFSLAGECDFSLEDMLIERRFPTASVMFRKADVHVFYELKKGSFDTAMWCAMAQIGRVHFLPNVSSVYRRGCGVTAAEPVRWVNDVLRFDEVIKANFRLTKKAKKERHRGIFWALKAAAISSFKKRKYLDFIRYSGKAVCYSPETFFREIGKKLRICH